MKVGNLTPQIQINQQQSTKVRQTVDQSFGAKMRDGLNATANAVGNVAGMAVASVPGGTILSAALSGAQNVGSQTAALTANAGSSPVSAAGAGTGAGGLGSLASGAPSVPGAGNSAATGFDSAKKLFEMQSSFNLEFLQLQANMQQESRQFQTVSNVMKNRTDTAKNSIRNIN
jgi:hypothetical protein